MITSGSFGDGRFQVFSSRLLTHALRRPPAAMLAGVSEVSDQGDGQRQTRRPVTPGGTDLIGLGLAIASALVLPALAGVGMDALLHSSPIGFVIGLAVGIVAAAVTAVSQFRRYL